MLPQTAVVAVGQDSPPWHSQSESELVLVLLTVVEVVAVGLESRLLTMEVLRGLLLILTNRSRVQSCPHQLAIARPALRLRWD